MQHLRQYATRVLDHGDWLFALILAFGQAAGKTIGRLPSSYEGVCQISPALDDRFGVSRVGRFWVSANTGSTIVTFQKSVDILLTEAEATSGAKLI